MRIAAFTMVRDESVFLPIWIRYYSKQLGAENLFILDHGTSDGSTEAICGSVIKLPKTALDERKRSALVSAFNRTLLECYDAVIFSDADELLIPDPDLYDNLADYVSRNNNLLLGGMGWRSCTCERVSHH